jgi:hypothetical protein
MALPQSALPELLEAFRTGDGVDLIRDSVRVALQELIELEATERIGAAPYERTEDRVTERNGHRPRLLTATASDVELRIPKLRKGSNFWIILEPRRRIDQALYAVVMEAYVHGISTRSVDDLVEAMGGTGVSKSEISRICAKPRRNRRGVPHPDPGPRRVPLHLPRCDLPPHPASHRAGQQRTRMLREAQAQDKAAQAALDRLIAQTGTTLPTIPGIAARAAAEILLEVGDVRRFTEPGFARYNGTAPLPASSGEAGGPPVRHRLNRGGNRRLNAVLHRAAMIQLRCEPRARQLYDNSVRNGHTRREAMRILKRHLSNTVYRTMVRDCRDVPLLT